MNEFRYQKNKRNNISIIEHKDGRGSRQNTNGSDGYRKKANRVNIKSLTLKTLEQVKESYRRKQKMNTIDHREGH